MADELLRLAAFVEFLDLVAIIKGLQGQRLLVLPSAGHTSKGTVQAVKTLTFYDRCTGTSTGVLWLVLRAYHN